MFLTFLAGLCLGAMLVRIYYRDREWSRCDLCGCLRTTNGRSAVDDLGVDEKPTSTVEYLSAKSNGESLQRMRARKFDENAPAR
jgi:hypothetical protein